MQTFTDKQLYYKNPKNYLIATFVPLGLMLFYQTYESFTLAPERIQRLLGAYGICILLFILLRSLFFKSHLTISADDRKLSIEDRIFPIRHHQESILRKDVVKVELSEVAPIKCLLPVLRKKRRIYSVQNSGLVEMSKKRMAVVLELRNGQKLYLIPANPQGLADFLSTA